MDKRLKSMFIFTMLLFISACGEEDVTEEINAYLEETINIEKEFEASQEKVFELEKEDEELYKEIIGLGSDDHEKVQTLADQAIDLLDKRLEYLEMEKASLEDSRATFENIEPLIEKITDEEQQELTRKMYDTMINRYDSYEEVYKNYTDSIRLTKELYTLFKEEEFNQNRVYSIIENVNDSYEDVLDANESFNKETVLYNELKQEYYDIFQKKE
ncbi:YkyA family protein [Pseudogracilibacillus sp. SO30301A]|uniref:YkyA family protein n=1 Tax=Pseudogracilibacillus sp. SO30301A TaxID=3098291 RepID=UPI00300E2040